jgi:hypothetical protein
VLDGEEHVILAAPILKYMLGWTAKRVLKYAAKKGWKALRS